MPDVETAVRVAPDGSRLLFLLNHRTEPVELTACAAGVDLLSDRVVEAGDPLHLEANAVLVLRERATGSR